MSALVIQHVQNLTVTFCITLSLPCSFGGDLQQEADAWGDLSGRLRSIPMHRDYTQVGVGSGTNTAVGLQLCYDSPSLGIISGRMVFDAVEELHRSGQSEINLNDDIYLLTEAWIRADFAERWKLKFGRQAVHGEIFQEDVYRHKSRAVEAEMELGTFSVRGRPLLFQALTMGLNHPLGALMLICESPFDGGADTAYLRAVYQMESTLFYALYAFTAHEDLPFNGHELNLVISHDLTEQWNIAVKFGYGLRHPDAGGSDQLSDSRFIVNYKF